MRPKIYLFGDSITEFSFQDGGWGASLANHFCRTVDVILRGHCGYNTRWALMGMERVFPADEMVAPLCVTVLFGANDACIPGRYGGYQHVPVDEYKRNLHSIVSFLKRRWPNTHVILITPPPIDEASRLLYSSKNEEGFPERTNEAAGKYARACVSVASQCQTPAIDIWTRMQQFPDWRTDCLCDGLHLTRRGNRIVYEEVVGKLKELGVSPETLPFELPDFSQTDPEDPLQSLSK